MKILMNFSDYTHTPERMEQNTYGGLGYYRIVKPSEQIKGHDVKLVGKEIKDFGTTLEEQWDNIFKEYDAYWTNYFCDDVAGAMIIYQARKHGKKLILDIDDNYFDIPESNLLYERFQSGKRERAMMTTILSFADIITTSTFPLKERLDEHFQLVQKLEKKIVVIPNLNDIKDWDFEPIEKDPKKIVIGYSGSNSHHDDLALVLPAVHKIMQKYDNVYFEMIGILDKKNAPVVFKNWDMKLLDRVAMVGATPTFKEYPEWLSQRAWDIGIAPLVDTKFTRCKSSIKWLEYSMFKIPTCASRVYPYFIDVGGRKTIEDGKTGLLCRKDDWFKNLERLVIDKDLRIKLGQNAYEHVKENWQYKDSSITKVIGAMLETK
ncbi:MAG: hypothetical protein EBR82_14385 [Caulobacteraceae bacterium]|nr:hypothetical protein [Caulobacteraceae bacterium]